jgi:hypothetical protein
VHPLPSAALPFVDELRSAKPAVPAGQPGGGGIDRFGTTRKVGVAVAGSGSGWVAVAGWQWQWQWQWLAVAGVAVAVAVAEWQWQWLGGSG